MKRKCVIVLGMHRSGTSALTAGISALGFDLGDITIAKNYDNPKGYYENMDVVRLNDRLLRRLGTRWDLPGFSGPVDWDDSGLDDLKAEARALVSTHYAGSSRWVLKDPRLCLTWPFWERVLSGFPPWERYFVHSVRSPLEVALSQKKRHEADPHFHVYGGDERYGLVLWYAYQAYSARAVAGERNLLVLFSELVRNPESELRRLANLLDVDVPADAVREFSGQFIERGLKHHDFSTEQFAEKHPHFTFISRCYQGLASLADRGLVPASEIQALFAEPGGSQEGGLTSTIDDLLEVMVGIGSPNTRLHDETRRLRAANDALSRDMKLMEGSSSWRITRPLRQMKDQFRRLRKGLGKRV